ncbi:hypothetical protein VTH06DRAFT_4087 [Thermothelomyces fergusii]
MDGKQAPTLRSVPRGLNPLRLAIATGSLAFGLLPQIPVAGAAFVTPNQESITANKLVPLEAHIMSKCPDARDCLRDLVLPTMEKVHDKVDFTLSYIGTPTDDGEVICKHGPLWPANATTAEECLGNIIELCAQHLYPDPKTYLGFTNCLTRDYTLIPQRSLIEDCALEHAVDFDKLNECVARDDGAFGLDLLTESVVRSAEVRNEPCTRRDT